MRKFETQWKALKVKQEEDPPETPKVSKTLPVIMLTESFRDFLNRLIGVRTIPLCYVLRETVNVPGTAPALAQNQPQSNEHESFSGELVARASHEHALFREDYASVHQQQDLQPTPFPSNLSSGETMGEELGMLFLDSTLQR
jgi:hypothetical protein